VTGLGGQLRRLARHSAIYGLGGLVSRILAVLLLPLYTAYLSTADYGRIETLVAGSAVLVILLRAGISSAFFRFYFDSPEPEARLAVLRTAFWFTMAGATLGLVAGALLSGPISSALFGGAEYWDLVIAAAVGLWAQMNYEQLTALFRVEERSTAFVIASLVNIAITIGATVLLVVVLDAGPLGVLAGNASGTLIVYAALLGYRREQLGFAFDRELLRRMNRFGLPLVPSALALWATNFSDRFFLVKLSGPDEVGRYSLAVRVASAMVLLVTAFRTAWPAFAYSIEDDDEARRTYGFVLTYFVAFSSWAALALTAFAPWIVRVLAPQNSDFWPAERVVGPLSFGAVAFAAYLVISIGVSRARRTQFNWIVTGAAAALNVALNLLLIPRYGMEGAAVATLAAYATLALGMSLHSQRVYPVPYQWRRVLTAVAAAAGLALAARALDVPLAAALGLTLAYPVVLLALGFYLPGERARLRSAVNLGRAH
jgi:O-antigen/teichoic acid export membrane protein